MKISKELASTGKINENASLRDKQALIINAKITKIWEILIDFENWKLWNDQIDQMQIDQAKEGAIFTWKIKGSRIKSTIQKIKEPELLSWTSTFKGMKTIQV
ncbi:MAG: putative membrane protein [Cyclobacteriaceae bacterium]|jgi:uncharacterized membrane protein